MSGVKRYNALGDIHGGYLKSAADGRVVLHTDHLASHAYDEAVELVEFEVWFSDHARRVLKWDESDIESEFQLDDDGEYVWGSAISAFDGWRACAKSRAKRAGGAEQAAEPPKADRPDIGDYAKRTAEDLRRRLDK